MRRWWLRHGPLRAHTRWSKRPSLGPSLPAYVSLKDKKRKNVFNEGEGGTDVVLLPLSVSLSSSFFPFFFFWQQQVPDDGDERAVRRCGGQRCRQWTGEDGGHCRTRRVTSSRISLMRSPVRPPFWLRSASRQATSRSSGMSGMRLCRVRAKRR